MARYATIGCEMAPNEYGVAGGVFPGFEGVRYGGSVTRDSAVKRSGAASWKTDSGAGVSAYCVHAWGSPIDATAGVFMRVYLRMTNLPTSTTKVLLFYGGTLLVSAQVTAAGKLQLYDDVNLVQIGADSAATMVVDTWYRIELFVRTVAGAGVDQAGLLLDGTSVASSTTLTLGDVAPSLVYIGQASYPGVGIVWHLDDIAINDGAGASHNSYPGDEKIVYLVATADSARGTNWVAGAGATTSLFEGVNNLPPVSLSSGAATNSSQVKNASGIDTTGNYDATMMTYTAAGIGVADTVRLVQMVSVGGSSAAVAVAAAHKLVSNPVQASENTNSFGGGVAIATYPDYWEAHWATAQVSPSVTLGTAPVARFGRRGAEAGELHVALMLVAVAYVPGASAPISTPILDTFNRADENPIVGWTTGAASGMKIVSNRMTGAAAGYCGAYLSTVYTGGNVEVYAQIDNTGGYIEELYYLSDVFADSNYYRLLLNYPAANQLQVQKEVAGVPTLLGTPAAWTLANGDWFGVSLLGGVHKVWAKTSAGAWTLLDTFTDSSHTSGVLGYITQGGVGGTSVGDFGGGQAGTAGRMTLLGVG